MTRFFLPVFCFLALSLSACTEAQYAAHLAKQIPLPGDTPAGASTFKVGNPYKIAGRQYVPKETYSHTETGIASWYGPKFHGKMTANGEIFNKHELTAAHRTLQMPSLVRVTNLENGRSLIVRVNDRGPYSRGRIIDLSERAAELLGYKGQGTTKVKIQVLGEESRRIADLAKNGEDTRGYEVALNNTKYKPQPVQVAQQSNPATPGQKPEPYGTLGRVRGHTNAQGNFVPDPLVDQIAVKEARIYVQAGAFSNEQNALQLSNKLSSYGPSKVYLARSPTGAPIYRVRLGPYAEVPQADSALASLVAKGNPNAVIVVD